MPLEDMLWHNVTDAYVVIYYAGKRSLSTINDSLTFALSGRGKSIGAARTQCGEFVTGIGTLPIPQKINVWTNELLRWNRLLNVTDMSSLALFGAYERHVLLTVPSRQLNFMPYLLYKADDLPNGNVEILTRTDRFVMETPATTTQQTTPEQRLAKITEELYDIMLGKPGGSKKALLDEYQKMTGKNRPGFM